VAITLPANAKPDLVVSNAVVGAIAVKQNGSYTVSVNYTISNAGAMSANAGWYDLAYLSTDTTLDNSDPNLTGSNYRNAALVAGASYTVTTIFTTTATTAPGSYTLFIKTDGHGTTTGGTNTDNGVVTEGNETNNVQALALTLPTKPDLSLSNVLVGTIVKNANGSKSIPLTYTVTNLGGAAAASAWYDLAYLSIDATLDNSDPNLTGNNYRNAPLASGASYTATTTFATTATTAPGNYTLFIKVDGHGTTTGGTNTDMGVVAEFNEANNVAALPVVLP